MDDKVILYLLENINREEFWSIAFILLIGIVKKEVGQYRQRKKLKLEALANKKTNAHISRSLKTLTNKYSNQLSKGTAVTLLKLVSYNALSSIMYELSSLYHDNISTVEIRNSLGSRIDIINGEHRQILGQFFYKDDKLENYCKKDIMDKDFIIAQLDNYNKVNFVRLMDKLRDNLILNINSLRL